MYTAEGGEVNIVERSIAARKADEAMDAETDGLPVTFNPITDSGAFITRAETMELIRRDLPETLRPDVWMPRDLADALFQFTANHGRYDLNTPLAAAMG